LGGLFLLPLKGVVQMEKEQWRKQKDIKREKFMTQDEIKDVDTFITELTQRRGDMGTFFSEWDDIEKQYRNDQPEISGRPNSRVNIMNANIEGQVSALVEQNIAITTRGEGPSDEGFAGWARIGLDWTLRKNHIKRILDVHERRRLKFGAAWLTPSWDANACNGFGLAKITPSPINKIYIDGKIKDPLRVQEADSQYETINQSKQYAIETYGKEKADAIDYGGREFADNGVFIEEETMDDETAFTQILRWSRHEGKLRLQEFSGCGLLLYDSHKKGKRKDNQKKAEYDHKPYYKYVNNKYPCFFTGMYPIEGSLYGFGDGKLLKPLQDLINELYDKIRVCARPNIVLFDTNSEIDLSDFDENSLEPRPYDGQASQNPITVEKWGEINAAWWSLLDRIHAETQRVTRFSDLMIGQSKSSDTATEAAIQQQQGNSATDHKKLMLQETLVEVCEYCLGLMMEFYTEAKAFRISEDKSDYQWIDFRKLTEIPVMKPATEAYTRQYKASNPTAETPQWELMEENGKPMTKNIDLDIEISIGAGLPKNKAFLWQMIEKLSGIIGISKDGMQQPLVYVDELRKFVKDYLGIPLNEEEMQNMIASPMGTPESMPMQNANAPLSMGGSPMTGNLSMMRGGQNGNGSGA
jgi:hypothetical protein